MRASRRVRSLTPNHRVSVHSSSRNQYLKRLRLEWLEDRSLLSVAPTGVDLLPDWDTGILDNDNLTNLDNSTVEKALQFEVSGTVAGATVTLYADGAAIGTATAAGATTTVATDGASHLVNGSHTITARQIEPGQTLSGDSPMLTVTVDTVGPVQTQQLAKLLSGGDDGEHCFGYSVSISGHMAIIGEYEGSIEGSLSGSAYVFEDSGSGWTEVAKLTASDGEDFNYFGYSVSISGDRAIIGAYQDDAKGYNSGSAYIFENRFSRWTQVAKLTAADGAAYDGFGCSVSISGDVAIVGAHQDADGGVNSGSAYIFEDTGAGWVQTAKFTAADGAAYDELGKGVSVSGSVAIVGAEGDDTHSGSAYVLEDTGSGWTQIAKLTASDGEERDYFGCSVSISGDTAIIGAYLGDGQDSDSGSAYVFENRGEGWSQVAELTAADGEAFDQFGCSVCVSGDTAIIGARLDDTASGSAYVFENREEGWSQIAKLTASDGDAYDEFGCSVSIGGDTAIVGAYRDDYPSGNDGSAYVFGPGPVTLGLQATSDTGVSSSDHITSDATPTFVVDAISYFRIYRDGVRISGDYESGTSYTAAFQPDGTYEYRVVGVDAAGNESTLDSTLTVTIDTEAPAAAPPAPDLQAGSDKGISDTDNLTNETRPTFDVAAAPYFRLYRDGVRISESYASGTSYAPWQPGETCEYTLTAVDAAGNESAPSAALAVTVDTLAPPVPAPPDLRATSDSGRSETDNVTSDATPTFDLVAGPYFRLYRGTTKVSGDYEVGDNYTPASQPDGTFDYTLTAVDAAGNESAPSAALTATIDTLAPFQTVDQIVKLTADDGAAMDYLGRSISISGNLAIAGAPQDDDRGKDSGSAHIFEDTGSGWMRMAKLTAGDGAASDWFGCSVSVSGTTAMVGALYDDDKGSGSGSVYVFEETGSGWTQVAKLTADDGAAADVFGRSVTVSGTTAIVGASGSAYVFQYTGSAWVQVAKLTASDGAVDDYFGYGVSIDGDVAVVGAYLDDDQGADSGSAYVFADTGSGWTQVAKLTAADGAAGDYFGCSVSISGTTAIVGAYQDDDQGANAGSAYIFEDSGSGWTQAAKLAATDGAASDAFGYSVAISGDRAVVGARGDDDKGGSSGSAYLFEKAGAGWVQAAKLTAADGSANEVFGTSVSISGSKTILGASGDGDHGVDSGSVYIFAAGAQLTNDTGANAYDRVSSDTTPELTFTFNETVYGNDSDVTVLDPNGNPIVPDAITGWGSSVLTLTFSTPLTVDGQYTVTLRGATILDAAGNALGKGVDQTATFTIDTVTPAAPVASPDLQAGSDTGISDSDEITNDATPTFGAIGAPYFRLYCDGVQAGGDYDHGSGTTTPRTDGTHLFTATAVDAAGNESAPSDGLTVTIDTQAPGAPGAPDLQAASDRGVSDSDDITNDDTPTFDAAGSPYFRVYRDGALASGPYESGASYTDAPRPDGVYQYAMSAVDVAGNESPRSDAVTVTIDTVGPLQLGQAARWPGDGASGDNFGRSVSVDGDVAIVGAYRDDDKGTDSGSAYVWRRDAYGWTQAAKLTAADGAASDYFGYSVSVSGSLAIVGAYQEDDKGGNSGSAYIFHDTGSGWVQVAKLTAADGATSDYFGYSVSISGSLAIVGAYQDDDKGGNSGSAYVFEDTGSGWTQAAKLTAADGASSDYFGHSVSIDGTRAIVGSYQDDDRGSSSGSAYVFENSGSGWAQVTKLTAADGASADYFGYSVSISGTAAVVGAYQDDDFGATSGSAYVFEDAGSGWTQAAKLTAADGAAGDALGYCVSINGDRVVVGAAGDDDKGSGSGSAYLFEKAGAGWVRTAKLTAADGAANDMFGASVSISGTSIVAGAFQDDRPAGDSGSAYFFGALSSLADDTGASPIDRITNDATPQLTFTFSEPLFGSAADVVVLDPNQQPLTPDSITGWGTTTLVVAFTTPLTVDGEYTVSLQASGPITDVAGNALDDLGGEMAFLLDITAPPAPASLDLQAASDSGASNSDDNTNDKTPTFDVAGVPYFRVYRDGVRISGLLETGTSYTTATQSDGTYAYTLTVIDAGGNESAQSVPLVVTIDTQAPAAPSAPDLQAASDTGISETDNLTNDDTPTLDVSGSPYFRVYRDGNGVTGKYESGSYTAAPLGDGIYSYTATAVDAAGNESLQGAALSVTIDMGGAYRTMGEIVEVLAGDGAQDDAFGYSVAVDGSTAVVGAWCDDDRGADSGSAYIFKNTIAGWVQVAKLTASDGAAGDYFGSSVSISGNVAAIGAYEDDDNGADSGSVYLFEDAGSGWTQVAKLTAAVGAAGGEFGRSVSVSEAALIVGTGSARSAYLFERTDAGWVQAAKLVSTDGVSGDYFGASVSICGSTAVVGAFHDDDRGTNSGSAYVFQRTDGVWVQAAKLTAADGIIGDAFGYSVSVSGNNVVVGTYGDDGRGSNSGSAYVFEEIGADWTQVAKLTAVDGAADDRFGDSVAVSGSRVLVGASQGNGEAADSGSVYAFERTDSGWIGIGKLTDDDGAASDYFGGSVALCGAVALIGAYGDDHGAPNTGSALFFSVGAAITNDTGADAHDGITSSAPTALSVTFSEPLYGESGNVTVVDPNGDPLAPDAVSGWGTNELTLTFGTPPSLDGRYTVTLGDGAAPTDAAGNLLDQRFSRTVVFTIDTIAPDPPAAPDLRASSDTGVSDSDDVTKDATPTFDAVDSPYFRVYCDGVQVGEDYAAGSYALPTPQSDGVHVYTITAVDAAGNESAPGDSLCVTIDTTAPGAPAAPDLRAADDSGLSDADDITNRVATTFDVVGSPYFRLYCDITKVSGDYESASCTVAAQADGVYSYKATAVDVAGNESILSAALAVTIDSLTPLPFVHASNITGAFGTAKYGSSVSMSGNLAIVGAHGDDERGVACGSAFVLERIGSAWNTVARLIPADGAAGDCFGYSVAISGNIAIVGAYQDDDNGTDSGSAYVFQNAGSGWIQVAKLTAPDGATLDHFGYSVSIDGATAVVGACGDDDNGADSGSVYVFQDSGSGWTQAAKLTATDGGSTDRFGCSASISGNTIMIGAEVDNTSGSAYVFENPGSGWVQAARLSADNAATGDRFGCSVSLSGSRAVVGASGQSSSRGAAYVFAKTEAGWAQTSMLTASDREHSDSFGCSVSLSGSMAVVGAYHDDGSAADYGAAYLFRENRFGWIEDAKLTTDYGGIADTFGASVAVCDAGILVGAPGWSNERGIVRAYTFMLSLDLQALSDTGVSDVDNCTNDATPTFNTDILSYFRVYRDGVQISGDYQSGGWYAAAAQEDGTYDYTVTAVDAAGNETAAGETLRVTFDTQAATIESVLVRGSAWSNALLDWLDSQGLGDPAVPRLGYRLPDGVDQLDTLPWGNIDTVTIVLSEDVAVTQADLTLAGVNVANYTIDAFIYDPATCAATWTLAAPINANRLSITLDDAVEDVAGNRLDGEWADGTSQFPSGNGTPGGDFRFAVNVLPGDANRDGAVNAVDASILAANWGNHGATLAPADFTGDGAVNSADAAVLAAHWGTTLPATPEAGSPEPIGPAAPEGAILVGPMPTSKPAARRPLAQSVRPLVNEAVPRSNESAAQPAAGEWAAAVDAALAGEIGPQLGQLEAQRTALDSLARSHTVARRQSHARATKLFGKPAMAADLLLSSGRE